jgi:hypothetical protein
MVGLRRIKHTRLSGMKSTLSVGVPLNTNAAQLRPKQEVPTLLHNGLHFATSMETNVCAAIRRES